MSQFTNRIKSAGVGSTLSPTCAPVPILASAAIAPLLAVALAGTPGGARVESGDRYILQSSLISGTYVSTQPQLAGGGPTDDEFLELALHFAANQQRFGLEIERAIAENFHRYLD